MPALVKNLISQRENDYVPEIQFVSMVEQYYKNICDILRPGTFARPQQPTLMNTLRSLKTVLLLCTQSVCSTCLL